MADLTLVELGMHQDYAARRERLGLIAERQASTVAHVHEQSQQQHLNAHALIAAKAVGMLNTDALAATRLQLAGSGSPPGFPPEAGNVKTS